MLFRIEQFAFTSKDDRADALLEMLGWNEWEHDVVEAAHLPASDALHKLAPTNRALLAFNYQAAPAPVEVERLQYMDGFNWVDEYRYPATDNRGLVSHVGMHCTEAELEVWKGALGTLGLPIVQEVRTIGHTNTKIRDSRRYHYCIFGAADILGFDLKFIVREEVPAI